MPRLFLERVVMSKIYGNNQYFANLIHIDRDRIKKIEFDLAEVSKFLGLNGLKTLDDTEGTLYWCLFDTNTPLMLLGNSKRVYITEKGLQYSLLGYYDNYHIKDVVVKSLELDTKGFYWLTCNLSGSGMYQSICLPYEGSNKYFIDRLRGLDLRKITSETVGRLFCCDERTDA